MPRFDCERSLQAIVEDGVTVTLCVPPTLLAYCQAAEQGKFPKRTSNALGKVGCGSACAGTGTPLHREHGDSDSPGLRNDRGVASDAYGISVPELYSPDSVGAPVVQTECRVVDEKENDVAPGEIGELVMRGPQFMLGYWKSPRRHCRGAARWMVLVWRHRARRRRRLVLRGRSAQGDDEVQGILDCAGRGGKRAARTSRGTRLRRGIARRQRGRRDSLRLRRFAEGEVASKQTEAQLQGFVADRLTNYKMPREIYFVQTLPRTASGKILRRELRKLL